MANTRVIADGTAVDIWFALPNYAANPAKPTPTELNAAVPVTASMAWDSYGFGLQASNQISDPSFIDVGNAQARGFAQFGGAISFFFPGSFVSDASNANYVTFAALKNPRTAGYIIIRADGRAPTTTTTAQANDFVNIYQVLTDGWDDSVEGEAYFKYAITFLSQGGVYPLATVATAVTVVTPVAVGTPNYVSASSGKTPLSSYITGRQLYSNATVYSGYPQRFNWSTSAPAVATVSPNGVVTAVSAGTANIIATDPISGVASTALAVTIT